MGIVKWQEFRLDETVFPIHVSCTLTPLTDGTEIAIEYKLTNKIVSLKDARISFLSNWPRHTIMEVSVGTAAYNDTSACVTWKIGCIDENEHRGVCKATAFGDTAAPE